MERAFQLGQSNEVIKGGKVFDLHNDYVPTAFSFDFTGACLRISFRRLDSAAEGRYIALLFRDVDVLEFSGEFDASAVAGLDEIGYKAVNDRQYDWFSTESQSTSSDHIVFRFDGGAILRVHSAKAEIVSEASVRPLAEPAA